MPSVAIVYDCRCIQDRSFPDLQDYILNFNGVEALTGALNTQFSATFKAQAFSNFTVRGQTAGLFKNAGTFSFIRFLGAGHEVPAYKVSFNHPTHLHRL